MSEPISLPDAVLDRFLALIDTSAGESACCNPAHIRPDTHAENCRDIAVKIASRRPRQLDFGALT